MSGLILDTRGQAGLEVTAPFHREELGHRQPGTKDEAYVYELPSTSTDPAARICGLSTRGFWIVFAIALVVLGAAIGGGVGGGLSASHEDKNTSTPQPSLASTSSVVSITSSSAVSSVTSTTTGALPFSTQPGTYRIINIATNTAIDLLNGNATNGALIGGWAWDPTTATSATSLHQTWQVASVDSHNTIVILNNNLSSYITAPSRLPTNGNPSNLFDTQVYGGVPGSPSDVHTQWTIVPNINGSISFSSKAYPNKVLDIDNTDPSNGTPILVWEKTNGLNQEWRLLPS